MKIDHQILSEFDSWISESHPQFTKMQLQNRLNEVNNDIMTKGIVYHKKTNDYLLTGYDYLQFYDWDLYFENIYALYNGESHFCFSNLNHFFKLQKRDGFIKRSFGSKNYGWNHPFKPFIAQTVLLGCNARQDYSYANKHFEQIEKYLQSYYKRYDFDKNELCCWKNADASGMDNQNSRVLRNGHGEGVDLNCYLYREYEALAILAEKIERTEKAELFKRQAEKIKTAINTYLWDEKTGFYYDRYDKTGELHLVKGISGFMPLWAGIATEEQAERLVKEHLRNPKEFASPYPIPALSMDSPAYKQFGTQPPNGLCNWNGTLWIPTNYMVFHGLIDYGYMEEAKQIALKTFEAVFFQNNNTREYYNAVTGEGYGRNPFYGWSALAYYMPLECLLQYDPTKMQTQSVHPLGEYFNTKWSIQINEKNK